MVIFCADSSQSQSGGTSSNEPLGSSAEPPAPHSKSLSSSSRQQHKRRITVVSSMAAKVPSPGQALYAASKATLHGYYHSLASELANRCRSYHSYLTSPLSCPFPDTQAPSSPPPLGNSRFVWWGEHMVMDSLTNKTRLYQSQHDKVGHQMRYQHCYSMPRSPLPIVLVFDTSGMLDADACCFQDILDKSPVMVCCRGVGVTVCCPGPIAATHEGQMRAVWGAQGLTSKPAQLGSGSRQHPSRVASLIGTATYHGLQECWISKHPILLLGRVCSHAMVQQCPLTFVPTPPPPLPFLVLPLWMLDQEVCYLAAW